MSIISFQKRGFLNENPLFKLSSIPKQNPHYTILYIYFPSHIKIKNECQTIPVLAKEANSTI